MKSAYLILFIPMSIQAISFPVFTGLLRYEMNKRGVTFPGLEAPSPSLDDFKRELCKFYTLTVEGDLNGVEERCKVLLGQWEKDSNKKSLILQAYRDFFSLHPQV